MEQRYLIRFLREDLQKKMVFIGGSRQVGKTTLARYLAEENQHHIYLNWDNPKHKIQIMAQQWSSATECLVFDEVHKYAKWKNLIKGILDSTGKKILLPEAHAWIYSEGQELSLQSFSYGFGLDSVQRCSFLLFFWRVVGSSKG